VPEWLGLRYILRGKLAHRDRLLDRITWRGDEVVLDAGAGAGLMGVGAARRVPRGRVLCVDLWVGKDLAGSGPDRVRRNATAEGVGERVEVRTGDVRALDLPNASVDVVFSVLCLHNIPGVEGRAAAARELARVLRPGGSIVIGDLAGTDELVRWFTEQGLVIEAHEPASGTFPPQKVLHARRPA
jgi:SAM-dependent methyltransferase